MKEKASLVKSVELSLLLVGISALFAHAQQETARRYGEQVVPYRFEQSVNMVSVAVAVIDDEGEFVKALTANDFEILEDGKPQEIRLFTAGLKESWVGLPPDVKEELSGRQIIGLLLDSSGSMENEMRLVREAAIKFLTNIPKTEQLFIMNFDENIRLSQYSSDDQRRISDRIYDIEAGGWTALYDAVATFLERLYIHKGRKTLVVFSDGVDSRSSLSSFEVLDLVKASDVTIHTIYFGVQNRSSQFRQTRFLRDLAKLTGGSFELGWSLEKLDELYDRIIEELFSQYTLGYVSTNQKQDGKYRKIKIEVSVQNTKVRAREGYYGPLPPADVTGQQH